MRVNYQTNVTPRLRVLSDDQVEQIVYSAMDVLQQTGTRVHEERALKLLAEAGCVVEDSHLVHIPAWLVEASLQSAPSRVVLAGRNREKRITLEKNQIYFGTGSDCPFILDPTDGARRRYTFEDVYRAAKIVDALPNIDFSMSLGLTSDVPIGTYDRHQLLAMLRGTTKPLVVTAVDKEGLADQLAMACAVLGSVEEWRKTPLFAVYIEPSSPLENSCEAVEKLLFAAENDIPAIYTPCPICGGTAPATLAGTLVQGLAECLVGVVISQLARKGASVIIGGVMSIMDMSTTVYSYGAPELTLLSAAMTNIAQYLRLPVFSTAGCSDSKTLDQQAGIEGAMSIAFAAFSGANLIHDVGYLESGLCGSYDMLVMSNEIISMIRRMLRGVPTDTEHLALDAIERVGPGGHYLMDDHTMKYFRTEFWVPELLDRANWVAWQANGGSSLRARVHEKVLDLIEHYEPARVAATTEQELTKLVACADEAHRSEEKIKLV
jgi:trimethylamine--corrinoid protein Co-methyltransferase